MMTSAYRGDDVMGAIYTTSVMIKTCQYVFKPKPCCLFYIDVFGTLKHNIIHMA